MKYFILFFTLNQILISTDFIYGKPNYQAIDNHFTYTKIDEENIISCDCGVAAELLPYNGEDIPMAKTEPCFSKGCQKIFIYE